MSDPATARRRVLLVERNSKKSEVQALLLEHGFEVELVSELNSPCTQYRRCDLLILGSSLNWTEKTEFRQRARSSPLRNHPILVLIGERQVARAWRTLTSQNDGYLAMPFTITEFVIKAVHMAQRAQQLEHEPLLQVGDLTLDPNTQEVCRGGRTIPLSSTTRRILELLMREPDRYISKEELEQRLWSGVFPPPESVRPRMYELRKAVDKPFGRKLIYTSRGRGYRIILGPPAPTSKPL